jgi:hypothetical protein
MTQTAVDVLVANGWKVDEARVGIRANGYCEYCDKDLFASRSAFLEWQTDHIVPRHAGGSDDDENVALACWPCNFKLKGKWDPRSVCGQNATRNELISAIRTYCQTKLERKNSDVVTIREMLTAHGVRPTTAPNVTK